MGNARMEMTVCQTSSTRMLDIRNAIQEYVFDGFSRASNKSRRDINWGTICCIAQLKVDIKRNIAKSWFWRPWMLCGDFQNENPIKKAWTDVSGISFAKMLGKNLRPHSRTEVSPKDRKAFSNTLQRFVVLASQFVVPVKQRTHCLLGELAVR